MSQGSPFTTNSSTMMAEPDPHHFRPLPLLGNAHVQTLLAYVLQGHQPELAGTIEQVLRLDDGDAMVLHDTIPATWQPGQAIAVLIHGLTGSHASPLVVRLAGALVSRGVRAVRVDLRGAGKALPLSRTVYHGGRSDDIRATVAEMVRQAPGSPITLIGVSLGGNLVLKLAGEAANEPVPGLAQVAALAPPVDLGLCAGLLSHRRNRIYERFFVKSLVADAIERQRCFPDLPAPRFPKRMTMRLFDELYTAPSSGFRDADDYYARASALPVMTKIDVPTLILTSRDDPFIAVAPFDEVKLPGNIEVRILHRGGHLGFLGWDGAGGIRWAERRIVEWVLGDGFAP